MPRDTTEAVVISSLRVRLAASEPKTLKLIGEESKRNRTDVLASRKIDQIIKTARSKEPTR
ncbi:MAG TPA: hypothetical protein VII95_19600 [Terriglobales bacterium]|jgi:hypothetical protein